LFNPSKPLKKVIWSEKTEKHFFCKILLTTLLTVKKWIEKVMHTSKQKNLIKNEKSVDDESYDKSLEKNKVFNFT
jgi:hypothetical protein